MKKSLTTVGNSLGIIIEKPILDLLGIKKDTPLEMITDGHRLIIEPVGIENHRERILAATEHVMKNHQKTLRKLAK